MKALFRLLAICLAIVLLHNTGLWAQTTADSFVFPVKSDLVADAQNNVINPRWTGGGWFVNNDFGTNWNSTFGCCSPGGQNYPYHPGMDYNRYDGTENEGNDVPVYSIGRGTVIRVKDMGSLGWAILIRYDLPAAENLSSYIIPGTTATSTINNASSVVAMYLHLYDNAFGLPSGDHRPPSPTITVFKGQLLGYISSNNLDHLHFSMHAGSNDQTEAVSSHQNEGYYDSQQAITNFNRIDPETFIEDHVSPVGYFVDGWHNDGISQAFLDKHNALASQGHNLGSPWSNGPYGVFVHEQEGMYIQDFYGASNNYAHPHTALVRKSGSNQQVYVVSSGFWTHWTHEANWVDYGPPVEDEQIVNGIPHQTFNNNGRISIFYWENNNPVVRNASGQIVSRHNVTFVSPFASRTEGDGVYCADVQVADFNSPIQLSHGSSFDSFVASINGQEVEIDPFTVNSNMTIYVDPVVSQVIDLTVLPSVPRPGQAFQVWVMGTESPDVTVSRFRVVLQNTSGTVLQTIYSAYNYDLTSGFDGVYVAQYATAGNYKIGIQYSLDNGSTWRYFDHDGQTSNPLNFSIVPAPIVPVANFSRTPNSGTVPLTVQFTDQSSNNPIEWYWSFGDGGHSTSQNPSHVYSSAGTYNVSLEASNDAGSHTRTINNCVTVNPAGSAPVANFSANTTIGVVPLTVQFTDQSSNNPIEWYWSFGDGGHSTSQNPSHVYNSAGIYTVTLLASNVYGDDDLVRTNYIHVGTVPLEANFAANVTSGIAPLTVQFTDFSAGNPTSWAWDLDGDSITDSNVQNPQFTYNSAGVYDVYLTVSDGVDQSMAYIYDYITVIFADCNANNIDDDLELTATVSPEQLIIIPWADVHDVQSADLDNDQDMDLVAVSMSGVGLRWYENVGGSYQEHVLLDDLNDPSVYAFKIVDLNQDGLLDIVSGCNAHVAWHQNLDGRHFDLRVDSADDGGIFASVPISVDAMDIDGDGDLDIISIVDAMDHAAYWYENDGSGNFIVRRTVYTGTFRGLTHGDIDADGLEDVVLWTDSSILWYQKMEAGGYIYFTPQTIVSSAGPGWIFSQIQIVDLDDDGDLDVCVAEETSDQILCYLNNGSQNFNALSLASLTDPHRLTVNDVDGDGDRDLVASTDNLIVCYFNDGTESFSQSTLTATFADASSLALVDVDKNGVLDYLLSASTTSTTSWFALNIPDRNHNGDLDECESLTDCNANGIGDQFEINMGTSLDLDLDTVPDECQQTLSADFVAYNLSGYPPLTVDFSDRSTGLATAWSWSFGDGQSSTLRHPQHIYATAGVYTVSLTVIDAQSATDTKVRNDYITVLVVPPLTVDFIADTTAGMAPLTVQFTDQSTGVPLSWEWHFGDGDISIEQNPEHTYQQSGIFTVVLQVSDGLVTRYKVRYDYIAVDSDCNSNSVPDFSEMAPYAIPHVVSATAGEASFVYPVDMDFDGDIDMVSAGYQDGAIMWHENLGSQSYVPHLIGSVSVPRFVYAVDLDNDGDLDVLSQSTLPEDGDIYWYENVDFSFASHIIPSSATYNIYPYDLDQDGDMDIVSPNGNGSSGVSWYANQGNGVFVEHNINSRVVNAIYPYDLDQDGDLDVLAAGLGVAGSGTFFYENIGNQIFSEHFITSVGAGSNYVSILKFRCNLAECSDLIVFYPEFQSVYYIMHFFGDDFGKIDFLDDDITSSWYVYPADIDGDGDQDLFSADMYGSRVVWYEATGAGSFASHTIVTGAYMAASVYPADIDDDGDLDVVVGAKGEQSILWYDIVVSDRNHNNILDECEIADGILADCNTNGIADFAEINMGTASDINDNGVPDECESLEAFVELSISNVDGELVLDWNDVPGASSYRVYGANNGGSYSLVASRIVSHYTLTGSMLDPGNVWLFYVTVLR